MSIKSLLQIILLLLIILIISGIYYLYFYSEKLNNLNNIQSLEKFEEEKIVTEENEVLESISKNSNNIKLNVVGEKKVNTNSVQSSSNNEINNDLLNKKTDENNVLDKTINDGEIKNLTKEIEYITSNKNGDIFKIQAKYGKSNLKNSNVLDLEKVNGEISSDVRSTIYLSSKYANYNYTNQNSKFFTNVIIKYDDKTITCDKLDLIISENTAIAYSNVIIRDNKSIMKAQIITLDIITKDININSDDKINIITNSN